MKTYQIQNSTFHRNLFSQNDTILKLNIEKYNTT